MLKYRIWSDNPTIDPISEALIFNVKEHTTKEIKYRRIRITLHSFIIDDDLCDPDSEILVKIDAVVGEVIYRNLIYYKNKYWMDVRWRGGQWAMPFNEYMLVAEKLKLDKKNFNDIRDNNMWAVSYLRLNPSGGPDHVERLITHSSAHPSKRSPKERATKE